MTMKRERWRRAAAWFERRQRRKAEFCPDPLTSLLIQHDQSPDARIFALTEGKQTEREVKFGKRGAKVTVQRRAQNRSSICSGQTGWFWLPIGPTLPLNSSRWRADTFISLRSYHNLHIPIWKLPAITAEDTAESMDKHGLPPSPSSDKAGGQSDQHQPDWLPEVTEVTSRHLTDLLKEKKQQESNVRPQPMRLTVTRTVFNRLTLHFGRDRILLVPVIRKEPSAVTIQTLLLLPNLWVSTHEPSVHHRAVTQVT